LCTTGFCCAVVIAKGKVAHEGHVAGCCVLCYPGNVSVLSDVGSVVEAVVRRVEKISLNGRAACGCRTSDYSSCRRLYSNDRAEVEVI
jgi:hypothetical protein